MTAYTQELDPGAQQEESLGDFLGVSLANPQTRTVLQALVPSPASLAPWEVLGSEARYASSVSGRKAFSWSVLSESGLQNCGP